MPSGLKYRMVDPAHGALDESYTPEDDSQEVRSVFSEEGTTRRTDNGVQSHNKNSQFDIQIIIHKI